MIQSGFFHHNYHIGCVLNLHSIINNELILGGQDWSRRQTVFFLPVDPRKEDHKDPERIDFSVPRLARYMYSAWKRHQDAVYWVDIDLAIREGLRFYQTRSNAIILQGTLPAHCIFKVERLKTGEMLYERRYLSPRPPPKISLKHDLNWSKGNDQGSTVEYQPVAKLVQQSFGEAPRAGSSKPTQFPKPIEDRTGKLVTQEIVGKSQGELSSSDRTGELVKDEEKRVLRNHDRTGELVEGSSHKVQEVGSLEHRDDADKFHLAIDDEKIDYNISGVPNAMVKRSHCINVHNFIQQIENHPQREALQSELQQHQAYNPFSKESKDADNLVIGTGIFHYIYHVGCVRIQSFFHYQQCTGTWRSKFEQKTNSVLLTCWSKKRRPQRSRVYRLLCTASCTICAKHLEKASGYGILD